ncbi:NACHT domain-containing protein [Catellatospora citrea]|uniref:Uncharacterized protein n=1 Tax=Catellatospora citrea TaxID=53366 RepID=A0A8J3KL07_9ACTN|nr:ATP-binding protein [Catellatospora citrea]RKE10490.1 hypothetical protein C8E86_5393 [Catellatospora citrea]GIF99000.1 hypothetical protein Cci01nite_40940 [Catellatospora citrea]
MPLLPEINYEHIRGKAPSGSRRDGFEELCNQLMVYGGLVEWPLDTTFATFGNPDGGREGRGKLPSGETWAWQAKYLFRLDDDEFKQIDKSVQRVLSTEPDLARYYIILPYNPPAGDTEKATSAWTKWNNHVEKSEKAAAAAGLTVTFEYIGDTQLNERLLQPSQAGRLRYWFDLDCFSDERFQKIAKDAADDADGRYTQELNVELPIAAVFDGLARTPTFEHMVRMRLAAVRKAVGTYGLTMPAERPDLFKPAVEAVEHCINSLEATMAQTIAQSRRPDGTLPDLKPALAALGESVDDVARLLREYCLRRGGYSLLADSLYSQTNALRSAADALGSFVRGRAWRAYGENVILITGTGGAGKTHLLCDLACSRTDAGLPTIIALGEKFERGPIESDLGRIIGFNSPAGQLLAAFDVACQTADEIGLVIIDGLNETTDKELWSVYLRSFLSTAASYTHLRVVLSCRTEFLPDTLPEDISRRLVAFEHTGFEEVPLEAIKQFLEWYGIDRPSFPMLDHEFTNPLFLKLLCTTLQERGERRFPRAGIGTSWIYDSFLDAMNARLAARKRCDYDRRDALVSRAVEQIAGVMSAKGRRLAKDDVEQITNALLPHRTWSLGLLNGLLKEAILSDLVIDRQTYIRFGYERLGDIALAKLIAAKDTAQVTIDAAALAQRWHANAGVLQALASVLPETHALELVDVLAISPIEFHPYAHTDFLHSLAWRAPEAVSSRTEDILLALQTNPDHTDAANNALLQVATVPDHRLNAEWLHRRLAATPLAQRDAAWSWFCDRQEEFDGHLPVIIDWAWSDASASATDHSRRLTAMVLAWTLSSSHRPTRDNATKALIVLLEKTPDVYSAVLPLFADTDDYIEERLLAVGCGIAQRTRDDQTATTVAEAVRRYTTGRGYWPENYLSRDYARRAIEPALERGWKPGDEDLAALVRPPYVSTWDPRCRSAAEIDKMSGRPDYRYSPVSHPVTSDFDDYRKYVIDSAVRSFKLDRDIDADRIGRILFDKALELGWTPELFATIDRHLPQQSSPDGKKHEGYAQKYIWTAFKQLVGRMTDRYPLNPNNRGDGRVQYRDPSDLRGYDIDPTVTLRRAENRTYADTPATWYAPADVEFPVHLDPDWAVNDQHTPRVDRLISCTDAAGQTWLVLEGHYQWSQAQNPEDAAAELPRHTVWAQIRSYLIPTADVPAWKKWAKDQNFYGRWMPESGSPTGLLLADHPHRSDWPHLDADEHAWLTRKLPADLVITTTRYGGANDWDQSHSKHLYTFMPSTAFCQALGLSQVGEFQWGDRGKTLVESFAARTPGPDSVHVASEALGTALRQQGRQLLWTILASKETGSADHRQPERGQPVFRTYSASYLFDGTSIHLLDAVARTLHAGGKVSRKKRWSISIEIPLGGLSQ